MLTKSILGAAALALAVPFGAFAATSNAGHDMQAAILNLDASAFTTNELAQIASQDTNEQKAERAAYLLAQKDRATVSTSGSAPVAGDSRGNFETLIASQNRDAASSGRSDAGSGVIAVGRDTLGISRSDFGSRASDRH